MWDFIKDHGANIVAFAALVALCYQIWSGNQQFKLLNKGYLQASPNLEFGVNNLTKAVHIPFGGEPVGPGFLINALNPVALLSNLGNLPLKYRVRVFDVWINDELKTLPLTDADHVIGLLFPKQDGMMFRRKGIELGPTGTAFSFTHVMSLRLKIHLKMEYHEGSESPSILDREYSYQILENGGGYNITAIRDRW